MAFHILYNYPHELQPRHGFSRLINDRPPGDHKSPQYLIPEFSARDNARDSAVNGSPQFTLFTS